MRAYALYGTEFDNDILYGNELSFTTQTTVDSPGKIRYFSAASFSIGTKVYLGLGYGDLPVKDFWEWDQITNVWTRKADYPGNSSSVAVSFSIGTKGYIGFGNDIIDGLTNEFWEYDPSTNSWTQKASLPKSRGMAVGFSIGTKGYIGTGTDDGTTLYKDFWEWDQVTDAWIKKNDFGGNARGGAVGFSIGNKGYIGTGGTGSTYLDSTFQDFWEWDQPIDTWTKKTDVPGVGR